MYLDLAKNGAPKESTANSNEIDGQAPGHATKKPSQTEEKTVRTRRRTSDALVMQF